MEKTIQQQVLDFQKKVSVIKKDAKNPHFKNTYATLTQILGEVKPLLSECGLVLTQPIINGEVKTIICGDSGCLESGIPLPTNLTPQQLGSAITYFRRYTLAALLALEIDDDDANEASKVKPVLQTTATTLPPLTDKAFAAMIKSIEAGDKQKVIDALPKYTLLAEQQKELDKLLN